MKALFLILTLTLTVNLFGQTEANIEAIRGIVGEYSQFDTTSNPVVTYIKEHIEESDCICYSKYDKETNTGLDYTSDFFTAKGLGDKETAYFYTTYSLDTSKTDLEFIESVLENMDKDFQERYINENIDYYNLMDIEKFNFVVFETEILTTYTYFDVDVFDDVTVEMLTPYKILVLIGYND
jgi:hypothetical protein